MLALLTLGLVQPAHADDVFAFGHADVVVDLTGGIVTIYGYHGVDGESFDDVQGESSTGPGAVVFANHPEAELGGFMGFIKEVTVDKAGVRVVMTLDRLHEITSDRIEDLPQYGLWPEKGDVYGAIGIHGGDGNDRFGWVTDAKSIWGTNGTAIWGTNGTAYDTEGWGIWGTNGTAIWGTNGTAIWGTNGTAREGEIVTLTLEELGDIGTAASVDKILEAGFDPEPLVAKKQAVELGSGLQVDMEVVCPRDAAILCEKFACQ